MSEQQIDTYVTVYISNRQCCFTSSQVYQITALISNAGTSTLDKSSIYLNNPSSKVNHAIPISLTTNNITTNHQRPICNTLHFEKTSRDQVAENPTKTNNMAVNVLGEHVSLVLKNCSTRDVERKCQLNSRF